MNKRIKKKRDAEVTRNGDKKETYVDVGTKVSNRAIKD